MEFQAHKYIFVFLLLLCHEVLLMEGRELKSMYRTESKQSSLTPKSPSGDFGDSGAVEGEEDLRPTNPGHSPGVGHPLEQDKGDGNEIVGIKHPVMGLPGESPPGVGHYLADKEQNDFRPTSPASGRTGGPYSHLQDKEENQQKSPSIDDFRPTTPGSSPGAGHSSRAQDKEENEQKSESHSVSDTDDFKPTNPGHSPGVGHSDRN